LLGGSRIQNAPKKQKEKKIEDELLDLRSAIKIDALRAVTHRRMPLSALA